MLPVVNYFPVVGSSLPILYLIVAVATMQSLCFFFFFFSFLFF